MARRVLLIDHHIATRLGVEKIVSAAFPGTGFGHAASAARGLETARREQWDIAILEVNLPGRGGIELIGELKAARPPMRVLVYTGAPEERMGVRALRAGADGFLGKDSPAEALTKAVACVLRGERYIGTNLTSLLLESIGRGTEPAEAVLSDREHQVLLAIASGRTPSEIARSLALSVKTVSTYRARILEKLHLRTTADLIRYAIDQRLVE
jgi:DNA-binding NarL/FixJ family response regulator